MFEQAADRRRFHAGFAQKAPTAVAWALAFGLAARAQVIGGPPPEGHGAQRALRPGGGSGPQGGPPGLPGAFKPVFGSGAQYELSTEKEKIGRWACVVVGKEKVGGDEGYWLEMRFEGAEEGSMVMKQLMGFNFFDLQVKVK